MFLQLSLLIQFKTWKHTHEPSVTLKWDPPANASSEGDVTKYQVRFRGKENCCYIEKTVDDLPLPLSSQESPGSDHWLTPLLKWEPALTVVML